MARSATGALVAPRPSAGAGRRPSLVDEARETLLALRVGEDGALDAAARWAFREHAPQEAAVSDDAIRQLVGSLRDRVLDVLRLLDDAPFGNLDRQEEGPHWADARAVKYLGAVGRAGEEVAEDVQVAADGRWRDFRSRVRGKHPDGQRALWHAWMPEEPYRGAPPIVRALAFAILPDVLHGTRKHDISAAVSAGVASALGELHRPGNHLREGTDARDVGTADGDHVAPVNLALSFARNGDGTALACAPADVVAAVLERIRPGVRGLGSLLGHRVLRWELSAAHRAALADGAAPPVSLLGIGTAQRAVTVRVQGGWSGLVAKIVGSDKSRPGDVQTVREIVTAQSVVPLAWPDGSIGPLVHLRAPKGWEDGRTRIIELTFPAPLLPHYVFGLRERAPARLLVPVAPLPPLAAPNQTHAAQAAMQWGLLVLLRQRADEYADRGGVELTPAEWRHLAEQGALPTRSRRRDVIGVVRNRWLEGDNQTPPFLRSSGSRRFALAVGGPFEPAHGFLVDAGRLTLRQRRRGRSSQRNRPRRRRR